LVVSLKGKIKELKEQQKEGQTSAIAQDTLTILAQLKSRVKSAFSELETAVNNKISRLKKLFHVKSLSTLLSQMVFKKSLEVSEGLFSLF